MCVLMLPQILPAYKPGIAHLTNISNLCVFGVFVFPQRGRVFIVFFSYIALVHVCLEIKKVLPYNRNAK